MNGNSSNRAVSDSNKSRRKILKHSASSIVALSGIGMASGKQAGKEEKIKRLIQELKEASNPKERYKQLSEKEKELVKEGLKPAKIGTVEEEVTVNETTQSGVSTQAITKTYTKRNTVIVKNNYGNKILEYNHKLDWVVNSSGEISSASATTSGSGFLHWKYSENIDPEEKTVGAEGCSSTKSGLFQYCNEVYGVGHCTKEMNTRLTSNISGFPNGKSSTSEDIAGECGSNC